MNHGNNQVLVIDDDEEMRSLLRELMQEEGYEVESVDSGPEAFRRIEKQDFDLIVTDIRMPGLSGLDILEGLRRLQPFAPVIVITAFGGNNVRRKAFEKGARAYLEKPIHVSDLLMLMGEIISAKNN
jgi:CheY-like chemotaxis protein